MTNEITTIDAEAEAKMAKMYGGKEASPIRRVKLNKSDRTMSYFFNDETTDLKTPSLKLTIIGIMRKYELKKFNDNTRALEYSFVTTEFPYSDWDYPVTVLDYTEKGDTKVLVEKIPANEFKEWCEAHDEKGREEVKNNVPFVQFSKYFGTDLGTTFKPLYILYGLDAEGNLYRVELTGSSRESLQSAMKKFVNKIPCYQPVIIKFEKELTVNGDIEFYKPIVEVGPAHTTEDKIKYMNKAQEFLVALAARQKAGGAKQTKTESPESPFESGPKAIAEPTAVEESFDVDEMI